MAGVRSGSAATRTSCPAVRKAQARGTMWNNGVVVAATGRNRMRTMALLGASR